MPIRKIKAGLVLTKDVDEFVGEPGYLFYDEDSNGDKTLRISDGVTPGGVSFLTAGDSSVGGVAQSTLTVSDDGSSTRDITLGEDTLTIAGGNSLTSSITGDVITLALDKNITVNQISSDDSTAVQVADNFIPAQDNTYSLGTPDKRFSEIHVAEGSIFLGGLVLKDRGDGAMQVFQSDGVTPADIIYAKEHTISIVGDDSTGTAFNLDNSIKFRGTNGVSVSVSGDDVIIDGSGTGSGSIKFVGDDSTGTTFDTSVSPDVRFVGAGNVSVAVSGSNVIITGSGAGGSATYTQDTAPSSPADGETWFDTDSGGLYIWLEEASGSGQWIETGSAGTTLDVDGVDSIRFAADDSTSTAVRTSETLSILGGNNIETSITPEGEIRISSTGSSVITDDTAPSSPADGDLWYDTDSGGFYVRVVEGASANWIEVGSSGSQGPQIFTQDDSPSVSANGDLWYDTDAGALYIRIVEGSNAVWVETAGTGQSGGGGITSLAADATPELGGNLNANSYNINNVSTISVATNGDPGVDPATDSGVGYIYAKGATAEMFVKDGAGNITQISPHNEEAEWIYYSENVRTGKRVKVNMEKMIRRLEEITGETFFEIDEPNKLKP